MAQTFLSPHQAKETIAIACFRMLSSSGGNGFVGIAKVDSLQSAIAPDNLIYSRRRAQTRLSGVARQRLARSIKPERPISVGGVSLTTAPASTMASVTQPTMLKR